ncbi:MAG: Bug family tripartite tricarboxylate transporter substrate binding protein [Pseudorhodoplanes sp.]|uniref:Bug family tripartite tricarboxylate transporter substrate binding protein n=1 Tax=Pseudorhodoplanes sp. TaxID=1934341 RepID=UPI003D0EAC12
MPGIFKKVVLALLAGAMTGAPAAAQTDNYPNRPIQVIIPFAGGSASDVISRIMLNRMSETLGQQFIVENRPGAGGNTGTAAAAKLTPDGYNLVITASGPLAANRTLFKSLGYDPEKDFDPISLFAVLPNVIVVNSKLPPKTLKEFIAYAKERPKQLNYGTVGVGSSQHIAGAFFDQVAGVELVHVPYRNIAQYPPDFIAGQVPVGFQLLPNILALVQKGDARPLAVTAEKRMAALPDVPTTAEAGMPGYVTGAWFAMLAPAGTPKPAIDKLYAALAEAIKDPKVRQRFTEQGAEPVAPGPEELRKFIGSETRKIGDIIRKAGVQPM